MQPPIDLGIRLRDKIINRYTPVDRNDLPDNYQLNPICYRSEDFCQYDVIFWHRLLKKIYKIPLQIECEIINGTPHTQMFTETAIFSKTEEYNNWVVSKISDKLASKLKAGEVKPRPINWKYFVNLPNKAILELGTTNVNTAFYIAQVVADGWSVDSSDVEVKRFIDLLLDEANRLKSQLFNPIKEFGKEESLKMYLLTNVYLANYLSAESMLSIAEFQEIGLRNEFMKYDARTSDMYEEKKRTHIDKHMLTCGMFYCSTITYLFTALEGFVNLVFHAFLRKNLSDKDFNIDQRLDLEQKLRFMTSICEGFEENSDISTTILSRFKTLKKYRNSIFHAKVEDSLKNLCFVEDGFLYTYDMDKYKEQLLPSHKIKLTIQDVADFKVVIDQIVSSILGSMKQNTRMLTEKYILNEANIPFFISEQGNHTIGSNSDRFPESGIPCFTGESAASWTDMS